MREDSKSQATAWSCLLGLCMAWSAVADARDASPHVSLLETTEYYTLDASTPDGLRRQIGERGPPGRERTSAAITRHTLSLQYWRRQVGDTCSAYGIQIEMAIAMRLPAWRPRGEPPPELVEQWRRLERALRDHEGGHRDNGVAAAHALYERLQSMREAPDCHTLKSRFDLARREAREALQAREDAFDRETDNGRRLVRAH